MSEILIKQLQAENEALKQDLKIIKSTVLDITEALEISENGVFKKDINVSKIIKKVTSSLMFGNSSFLDKINFSKITPLLEKYKNL